jgi:hypothetical protein
MKVGERYVWKETFKDTRGTIVDIIGSDHNQNVIIQWYENGKKTRLIRYHISQIIDEKRLKIDKQYYREQKLIELGI